MSRLERMTRLVVLSSTRPRKPLTSPAASQRGEDVLTSAGVAGALGAQEAARQRARAGGERRAPEQRATMVGNVLEVELQRLAHAITEAQPGPVRACPERVVLVEDDLDAGMLTLGVRGEEHPQPSSDLVVGAAGEHGVDLTLLGREERPPLPPPIPQREFVRPFERLRSSYYSRPAIVAYYRLLPVLACGYRRRGRARRRRRWRAARATRRRRSSRTSIRCNRRRGTSCTPPRKRTSPGRTPCRDRRRGAAR